MTAAEHIAELRAMLPTVPGEVAGPRSVSLACKCGHRWRDTVPAAGSIYACPACDRPVATGKAERRAASGVAP